MKYKQRLKRFSVCFICLFLIAASSSAAFCAQSSTNTDQIDINKTASLTLINQCSGTDFHIYKVASVGPDLYFTRTERFKKYDVSLNQTSEEGWKNTASALSGYAARDNLTPDVSGTVGSDGSLVFSNLTPGLYLVIGETGINKEGYTYKPQPFLICLPNKTPANEAWQYDVTAKPKCDITPPVTPGTDYVTRKVMKVWNDGNQTERPASVTVQLLRNGQVWAEVTLSAQNDWRYTWDNLDSSYQWQIVEKNVPDGYSVGTAQEGNIFIITNTKNVPENPEKPNLPPDMPFHPDRPTRPEPNEQLRPMVPDELLIPFDPSNQKDPNRLPQTGMLWWPVPLMAFFGTALFMTGWFLRKKRG